MQKVLGIDPKGETKSCPIMNLYNNFYIMEIYLKYVDEDMTKSLPEN